MGLRERVWPGLRTRSIWLDVVLALLSTIAIATGGAIDDRGPVPVAVFAVLTAATFILMLALRRRAPFWPFMLSALVSVLSPAINGALFVLGYAVGRYDGRWPARIAAAVTGMVVLGRPWEGGPAGEQVSRWLGGVVLVVLPGAIGIYVRTRAQLLAALRERAERAEAERELLARDAVLTERTRIAREMHDAVGHRVTLMVLQAGAIEMAAGDPARVEQLAGQAQTAGRQALDELRQMVGVLRAGEADDAPLAPQPDLSALARLVDESRQAGMAVEFTGPPDDTSVDPAASRAAYRIVQEALTNAGKHAPGAAVTVAVERPAGQLVVRVLNGPGSAAGSAPGGGYGLVGLGERVRTLGGRLTTGPRLDGGFCVEAALPAEPR